MNFKVLENSVKVKQNVVIFYFASYSARLYRNSSIYDVIYSSYSI